MIVLDTNVLSELMRPSPDARVGRWMSRSGDADVYITAMTAAELLHGVARLPSGARRTDLSERLALLLGEVFADRLLPFDGKAAIEFADLVAMRESVGRPIGTADAVIAASARAAGAEVLATRNVSDFAGSGLHVVDPWNEA